MRLSKRRVQSQRRRGGWGGDVSSRTGQIEEETDEGFQRSSEEEKKELLHPKNTVLHEEESRVTDPVSPVNSSTSTVSLLQ